MHKSLSSSADQLSGEIGQVRQLAAEMQEAEQKKRAEQMARRAMGKMNNMSTGSCFQTWSEKAAESRRQKQLTRQAAARFRNAYMVRCYNHWAGVVREAQKQRQQEAFQEQQASLHAVLARLDPDGDGVVDQNEFTEWAQIQALRVESWEKRLDSALSEGREQLEQGADQAALESLSEEIVQRFAELETQLRKSQSEQATEQATRTDAIGSELATAAAATQAWQSEESRRVFEHVRPLLAATVEETELSVKALEESMATRLEELMSRGGSDVTSLQKALAGLEAHVNSRERAVETRLQVRPLSVLTLRFLFPSR